MSLSEFQPHRWRLALIALAIITISGLTPATVKAQLDPIAHLDSDEDFLLIDQGYNWREIQVVDPSRRVTPGSTIVVVWPHGVDTAPLPEQIKEELHADFAAMPPWRMKPENLQPSDAIFVDRAQVEAMVSGQSLAPWLAVTDAEDLETDKIICSSGWTTKAKTYDWAFDEGNKSGTFAFNDDLSGNYDLDVPLRGDAHLEFKFSYKKNFLCIPYKYRYEEVKLIGNLDILGSADLTANATITGHWQDETKVAEPKLATIKFSIAGLPVSIKITMPVFLGYDIKASATGDLSVNSTLGAQGPFNVTCTRQAGCSGGYYFDQPLTTDSNRVSASVELDIEAQLNARLMLRASLISSSILFVEAGAKGLVNANLWGYRGNTCGDGDGDGHNETVEALVADAEAGLDWVYGWGGRVVSDHYSERLWRRWWLGHWDLLGDGGSTALSAMIQGPDEVQVHEPASYDIKLRPCYPFDEPVQFGMAPGAWDGELVSISKGETKTVSRTFTGTGSVDLRARLTGDTRGRAINVDQWRTIDVVPPPEPPAGLILSYVPHGQGQRVTYRSETDQQTATQIFRYEENLGNFENRQPGGFCPTGGPQNWSYVMLSYDGPIISSCRFQFQDMASPSDCDSATVAHINSGEPFIVNTDKWRIDQTTCDVKVPAERVCGPNDYCWAWVEFRLPNGQEFARSVAYRRNY
ncbi:MAG: hypothetical protein AAF657_17245 [Acidobacteriota bacterium]